MSRKQSAVRLLNAVKRATYVPPRNNMLIGKVTSTDPLEIQTQQGLILTEKHLMLGEALRPHNVSMPHTHQYNGTTEDEGGSMMMGTNFTTVKITGQAVIANVTDVHSHEIKEQVTEDVHATQDKNEKYVTITMYPPLHESDKVLLFAMNDFQMYYVAERIEIGEDNKDYDTN